MKVKENTLVVPEQAITRNRLRKAARELVAGRGIVPPGSFVLIQQMADEVIAQTETDESFREFAMVVCGNEIWRSVVAATPYNRRLLLLPQCLKNNSSCHAEIDQLGLICAGCQSCQIDSILQKAESLGYATLVAEGTTVAVSLVQEGSVDAVIGVSCMSVLQKSFEPVSRAAVPVIGVPLLFEGCAETDVDNRWLDDELTNFKENTDLKPLSVSALKEKVNGFFTEDKLAAMIGSVNDQTTQLAIQSMLTGGQRIRPLLTALAYKAYAPEVSEDLFAALSVVVECFHKASLIHDDIEDNDDFRYDTETIHKQNGIPVAINTGDFLLGKGYELLGKLPLDSSAMAACYQLVASGHVALSLCQGADLLASKHHQILSLDQQLEIFERKTGSAIRVALMLGAVAAHAPKSDLAILRTFSGYFGMAYQIKDDLDEFRESNEHTQVADYPLMLSLLAENAPELSTEDIRIAYAENDKKQVSEWIELHQIVVKAEDILQEYTSKSYRELDKLENLKMKLSLYTVLGKIF
ncbi:MAG: polyprenyl synthetase family protein [Prolixibacteraceae bacterium]|nr:polyprenyl synthetase family protein [Prolixibacteraceae bacterium]